jgi:hypothetical protein
MEEKLKGRRPEPEPDPPCTCNLCRAFFRKWPVLTRDERYAATGTWDRRRINVTNDYGYRKKWTEAQRAEYRHYLSKRFCG